MLTSAVAGFSLSIALIVAIGAQNAFVLRQGLRREHVVPVVLTCALSDALLIGVGIAGVGSVVAGRPDLVTAIRWGGAAFLLGYAALAARRALRPAALTPADRPPVRLGPTLLACLAFTYLNPHVYLDTVLLLGGIAQQHPHRWLFGLGAAAASVLWFTALGAGAYRLAPLLARTRVWQVLDGVIAVVMVAVAVALLLG
ncbi:L-lysine exporter family protein LysE/ArgO [Micromonospora phaseoli]|uniref:L-lysine exporter family protein LysE/ArgO n=1 Tax=Micromonospora phaseoli TaxID=1144548 RepID=A0A1H6ZPS2_9ACTN|nr:LysE/ArgO family amino acid transporter [Micromonospora phaseoli]PZV97086.1 L-lysine exporter family protein LysE/ArgO [Micromonospora phaseoli]GIJ77334.1 amino acid transporter [Micromonospora phaseoli]SEJ55258.1 L-lysine exporter family protein LysE/ArgO [Micromonospora phaseoli]